MIEIIQYLDKIDFSLVHTIVFHAPKAELGYSKLELKSTIIKETALFQAAQYKDNKVFHENIALSDAKIFIANALKTSFSTVHISTTNFNYDIKYTNKGKILFNKVKNNQPIAQFNAHNREKQYLIKENTHVPALVDLGIFTKDGKIVNSKYDKFKQINRFLELVDDVIDKNAVEVNILDLGCGKSYLTFVVYHYVTNVLNIKANMIGLDLKTEVVNKCNETAKKYSYQNLKFVACNINDFCPPFKPDIIISLHACDIATDYVLFNAIKWNVKNILSVPCCQHELNEQIETSKFAIITKYGIAKERFAALFTDIIRTNLLEACGYKAQLIEFVDLAHSPKNLLLRGVKSNLSDLQKSKSLLEVNELIKEFNLNPTLFNLLKTEKLV